MTSESLRVIILTVLPENWSIWKVQEVLPSASDYMISRAEQVIPNQAKH